MEIYYSWIENLKAEKRTMIQSLAPHLTLQISLKGYRPPEIHDKVRDQRTLEASLDEADYEDKVWLGLQERSSENKDSSSRKQSLKAEEYHSVPFTSLIIYMLKQLYPDPFDEFDPHQHVSGKKAFTNVYKTCRL